MYRGYISLVTIIFALVIVLGCSKGGDITSPNPIQDKTAARPNANQTMLGLYTIEIDGNTGQIDVIPHRGPDFQVNVVKYLQPPSGDPSNLGVLLNPDGTDISEGIFDLDIFITHPFTGTNLRGFDVRGIVMGEKGTQLSQFDHDVQYPKPTELRLLNADGYTRWWNETEFPTPGLFGYTPTILGSGDPKATVNGYKYFSDDLTADDPMLLDPESRGTFSTQTPSGDPNTLSRNFVIRFPMVGDFPRVKFRYAICASFAAPHPDSIPPAEVDDFDLNANCPEAYQLSISMLPNSTAYWTSTQGGGDLILNIEIADWQAVENPEGISGEIASVRLESPTLWDGLKDPIASGTPIDATIPNASAWQVEIENVTPTDEFQDVFLIVQSADPTSYAPPVPDGGISPGAALLSAYHLYTMRLPGNSEPIIGDIYGPTKYVDGATLTYTLSSMTDLQDGSNLTVKWDFDNDGIFEDDLDGSDTNMEGRYLFTGDGTYYVQCRVYDLVMEYTDSNIIEVVPLTLPFDDPMDATTETLWTVQNGLFDIHSATLEWHVDGDHWATGQGGSYQDEMNTTLISPVFPAGQEDTVQIYIDHRYTSEGFLDYGRVMYKLNGGSWTSLSPEYSGSSPGFPDYIETILELGGLEHGDYFQLGFAWDTDYSVNYYNGWDITRVRVMDNKPPIIEDIFGPAAVDSQGPWAYTTVATDIDGIDTYMWSVEPEGVSPIYDDPGDGVGHNDITFEATGNFDIFVEVTDLGDPPLSATFGPYSVTVFFQIEDAFFTDHFEIETGDWWYTGGTSDGAHQEFWNIDTPFSYLTNVGEDGCYAETDDIPTEKTASVNITIPISSDEVRFRMLHRLGTESGGGSQPFDGQWVTLDGTVIEPSFGFLTTDDGGEWPFGYFVGETNGFETSTFVLGTGYNDGNTHMLTFHSLSTDTATNCGEGWDIDLVEMWFEE